MIPLLVAVVVGGSLTALFAMVAWARERWLIVTVVGQSMEPMLVDGQRALARRPQRGQRFAIGDVVVFALPERLAGHARANGDVGYRVKRIAAVGDDPLPVWLVRSLTSARIPEGHFAVIGDAPGSEDSRHLGLVARTQIIAWLPRLAYRDVRRRREPVWEPQEPAAHDQPDREAPSVVVEQGRGTVREKTIPVGCIRLMARRRGSRS
ncbi:MAG TPA: S26 family signal peptidase [Kofleriaceae bacterium]|nr:S26 family signal peptidase [Kofleriaceae bacterium]